MVQCRGLQVSHVIGKFLRKLRTMNQDPNGPSIHLASVRTNGYEEKMNGGPVAFHSTNFSEQTGTLKGGSDAGYDTTITL